MISQNSKIVVIDDKYDDVKHLLLTLNKNGTGLIYFKGDDLTELPDKPLKGIRLLFLDFVLGTDGQPPKTQISTLISVLRKTIATDNGPYLLLAWTGHSTPLLNMLKQELITDHTIPRPMAVIDLEKKECQNDAAKIVAKIEENLAEKEIIELLIHWENQATTATSQVLGMVSEISRPFQSPQAEQEAKEAEPEARAAKAAEAFEHYSKSWKSAMERHVYRIAESALGKTIKPDRDMLMAAQISFTELFKDQIESLIRNDTLTFKALTDRIAAEKPYEPEYSSEEKAKMNSHFLLVTREMAKTLQPGNIYLLKDVAGAVKCETKDCHYDQTKITEDQIRSEAFQETKIYKDKPELIPHLIKEVIPLLIEVTALCDYANDKWKNAKLLFGMLWPEATQTDSESYKTLKKAEYLYPPIPILYEGKIYRITFNANRVMSVNFNLFANLQPILRARKEFLVDIQHWCANQMSRPGKTQF